MGFCHLILPSSNKAFPQRMTSDSFDDEDAAPQWPALTVPTLLFSTASLVRMVGIGSRKRGTRHMDRGAARCTAERCLPHTHELWNSAQLCKCGH